LCAEKFFRGESSTFLFASVALLLVLYGVFGAVGWFFNGDLLALLMLVCVAFGYVAGLLRLLR